MGLLKRLFRKSKSSEADIFQTSLQIKEEGKTIKIYVCNGCAIELLNTMEDIFGNGDIYCSECMKINDQVKVYLIKANIFEVFVYSYPWNPYIRSYAPPIKQWLPTYQADTGGINLDRNISKRDIPLDTIYASITLAMSQHGSFTFYANIPALIAINEKINMLCAYVSDDVVK